MHRRATAMISSSRNRLKQLLTSAVDKTEIRMSIRNDDDDDDDDDRPTKLVCNETF